MEIINRDDKLNEDNEWLKALQNDDFNRPKPAVGKKRPVPKFIAVSNKQRRGIKNG